VGKEKTMPTNRNPRGEERPRDGRGGGNQMPGGQDNRGQGRGRGRNNEPCQGDGPGRGRGQGRGDGRGRRR